MDTSKIIPPHGADQLKILLLEGTARQEELRRAQTLPKVMMSSREVGDLIMLGIGGFTPLDGFMGHDDWKGVCAEMKMSNGIFWPILEDDEKRKIIHLTNRVYFRPRISPTFHGRDIFAPVAAHLSLGVDLEKMGINHIIANMIVYTDPKESDNVARQLSKAKEVLEASISLSEELLIIAKVVAKNREELHSFVAKKVAPLQGVLRIRTSIITKKYKEERFLVEKNYKS